MKEELTAAGEFDYHMATLNGYTKFLGPQSPFPPPFAHPGYNADVVRSLVQSRLCYILAQNDNATDKVANMDYFKQFTNNACLIGTGWSDFIKPDFITYHHQRPYPYSYGGFATSNAILINYILKSTPYELDAQAQQNIKNCLMVYPKICADFDMPRSLTGRFPGSTSVALAFRYFFALLYATDPNNNQDAGKEFKRIYALPGAGYDYNANTELMLGEIVVNLANNAAVTQASPITGHFGFPYAGLNIHKYNGYQASVSGLSQYILNYEANATENLLGRYQSSGAMELLTVGNPKNRAANGLGINGWDWVHVPGVTGENVTFDELAIGTPKEFNDRRFLAHATLNNYGVFAMDYKDINSSPKGLSAYKTSFFYKDKILCLGTGIKHTGGTKAIHTTLFQTALTSAVAPTLINGTPRVGLSDTFSQTNGSLWATDAVGNGYVIPASEYNNNQIVIARSTQTSRDVGNTTNTQGDYAKAYLNHGVAPANGSYRYAIVMQGNTAGTQDLASNFASYFDVLQQDNKAHVVKFVEDNTYNYAIFDATAVFTQNAVKKVDKPCVVITQAINQGNNLKVSLTNPDLGLLNNGEVVTGAQVERIADFFYRAPKVMPVKLNLSGKWKLAAATADVALTVNGDETELVFSTINGKTIQTELVKAETPPVNIPEATITGTTSACLNSATPAITFTGANGTAPYTFTYTVNDGSSQTVSTKDTEVSVTVPVPTNLAGKFTYTLSKVKDSNSEQVQSGSATVTVNALPAASISGSATVSQNSAAPTITFTGSSGTAPYTFTYNVNGAANQTITATGNTATVSAPTNTTGSFVYNLVSVADANCNQLQSGSATIVVNALPTAGISGNAAVCLNSATPAITFTGANGTAPYTFTYAVNGGSSQTVSTKDTEVSVTVPVLTNLAGKFTYTLSKVKDASSEQLQSGSATVTVNALPAASISGSATVSQNSTAPTIVFTGSSGTAPYTFTYNVNGSANKTITATGNTATVSVSTNTTGSFVYNLVSVADANCNQLQSGSATVVVNALPTASISGNAAVCLNSVAPTITFTGANGTAPYTFTYTINDGSSQTMTSNGITATIKVPTETPGTFSYRLINVADVNTNQKQSEAVTVTVNSLPVVSIHSNKGTFVQKGDILILTATGGEQYRWSGANIIGGQITPAITIKPTQSGTYKVTATNASGCVSDQTILITVIEDYKIEANNVLTPNSDGYNDKFIIKNIDHYPNNKLKIFDKAGRVVYTKQQYANDWDGTINGNPLNEGTYYYIIDLGSQASIIKGFISIIRN